ncbi:class I SAM-dependent methyltransferase [Nguyenibacter vanlangensis]|uniref:Class I SAM-dependent methyltransferase n=1 Tax=Nguyenibacter vanlangensis TaxID=1216886 RepID=A0A7Y7M6X4_9PROT|nr:class I SAM-dependent methyltransferase [Nguyenibacter vanlangensis]NVN11409.1 class I SAM-dependent methyltransferase [Nguyenibacter vanlangensis]
MSQATRHYDELLARHYSWMNGLTLNEKIDEQKLLLAEAGLDDGPKDIAVDLGCGPGYQSFALARLGYKTVIAVDASNALLAELEAARAGEHIRTVLADLRNFPTFVESGSVNAIICMGDTLTHLDERSDVTKLYRDAYAALAPGGRFVLTFRDLSHEREGLDRFLPVRADERRIMTCFLEYEADHVVVNDLIHVRDGEGWTFEKSRYRKLRLAPAEQAAELERIGFTVDCDRQAGGLHMISARKP